MKQYGAEELLGDDEDEVKDVNAQPEAIADPDTNAMAQKMATQTKDESEDEIVGV